MIMLNILVQIQASSFYSVIYNRGSVNVHLMIVQEIIHFLCVPTKVNYNYSAVVRVFSLIRLFAQNRPTIFL